MTLIQGDSLVNYLKGRQTAISLFHSSRPVLGSPKKGQHRASERNDTASREAIPRRCCGTAVIAAEVLGGRKTAVPNPTSASRQTMGKADSLEPSDDIVKRAVANMLIPSVQSIRDPSLSYKEPEMGATKNKKTKGTTMNNPTFFME